MASPLFDSLARIQGGVQQSLGRLVPATIVGDGRGRVSVRVLMSGAAGLSVGSDRSETADGLTARIFDPTVEIRPDDQIEVGQDRFLVTRVRGTRRTAADQTRYISHLDLQEID